MAELMSKSALTALKGSIRKWEKIVDGTGIYLGIENCPLCKIYYWGDCKGCPVFRKTGKPACEGTPYESFCESATTPAAKREAGNMLKFLRDLMPGDRKP